MFKLLIQIAFLLTTLSFNSLAGTNRLQNVTSDWTFRGEVISAFSNEINKMEKRENFLVFKVYEARDNDGEKVRFELFYTGDDAEYYPQFYIITNARRVGENYSSKSGRSYYIKKFSSPDLELGEIAPELDPFELTDREIKLYILKNFLNSDFTTSFK